ncbi:MAG: hypothetical protein LBF08_01895 [Dysgonamonadaceae bacterium]|nr:hypothetical protein [Dysgonamonadaceae bacterium]
MIKNKLKRTALLKNCGTALLLSGELCLIIPFFLKKTTNTTLAVGLSLVIAGFVLYVIFNKKSGC